MALRSTDDVNVEFMDEQERFLFAEARLGEEAVVFLHSELGQLLRGRAEQEVAEAQHALLGVDPEDPKLIRELQFKAQVAQQFMSWMAETIRNGDQAYEQLKQSEH